MKGEKIWQSSYFFIIPFIFLVVIALTYDKTVTPVLNYFKKINKKLPEIDSSEAANSIKENSSLPKQAAYFCLSAPFIISFFESITRNSINNSKISEYLFLFVSLGVLLFSSIAGIYSLVFSKKAKGVLIPAIIGLLLHVFIGGVAYSSFIKYRSRIYSYFSINYIVKTDEDSYEQLFVGRTHHKAPIDKILEETWKSISAKCPKCEMLNKESYQTIPEKYHGIFDNAQFKYTYVTADIIGAKRVSAILGFFSRQLILNHRVRIWRCMSIS